MQFLNGLNDSYSQVRTQILMMEPSPSIDKTFSGIPQVNSFPFTSEQYQQLISMLNSHHASTSGAPNDALHSANSALSSNVCNTWSNFVSLDLHHSLFAVNPVNKTAYGNDARILDTGATDHIIHSLSLFTHITSSICTFVQLPNGEKVTISHIGTIQVTSTLKLENVLCVPSFNFNLISVSQLTKTLSCCLVFLSNLCFIQDLTC